MTILVVPRKTDTLDRLMRCFYKPAISSVICGLLIFGFQSRFANAAEPPKTTRDSTAASLDPEGARHFDTQIAPLLGRRCLECHRPDKRKGGLDLSQKDAAFAGGKTGKAIVPGNLAESLLWEYVETDEMPEDNPPLSPQEKELLRNWIENGAVWSENASSLLKHLPDRSVAKNILQRLTVPEYIASVRAAVGVNIEHEARRILPQDLRADGFFNTAYNLNVDLGHVEAYSELAEMIVDRMDVRKFASQFVTCEELSEPCMRELIARIGKWVLRAPPDDFEINSFLKVSAAVSDKGGDYTEAVRCIVEAMLQSPRFIYRIEKERGNGEGQRPTDYELASRLSYILWGAPPDRELMKAADAGELKDSSAMKQHVDRMLQDPRAIDRSAQFIYEWLNLARLDNLRPDKHRFSKWKPELAKDMREETLAFFRDVAWNQNRPLSDLMNAQVTYTTRRLAAFYGFDAADKSGAETDDVPEFAIANFGSRPEGLQALYRFDELAGDILRDTSGVGEPLDLKIEDPSAIEWGEGKLEIKSSTRITTTGPAKRLINALKESNAVTIEAWITPANTNQTGPARIVTLSSGTGSRNFTLGQDGNRYEVRFRTTKTDGNGLPGLASKKGAVRTRLTHVVYTRDMTGRGKLYVNGAQSGAHNADGDHSNWQENFHFGLANESTKDRPWAGTFHMLAIYDRALSPEEIRSRVESPSRYDLGAIPGRGGLLTQGSVLTVGGDEASMVARGLFVLRNVLWGSVDDPPPCVDTTPVPTQPGMSQRAISEARLANKACTACHSSFEPLAFGLEKFDGLGAYHEVDEHGNKLREDGEILFPGAEKPVAYKSASELMDLLARSDRVRVGITRKLTQFALGRPLTPQDAPAIDKIHESSQKNGGTYAALITAIITSDLVQK